MRSKRFQVIVLVGFCLIYIPLLIWLQKQSEGYAVSCIAWHRNRFLLDIVLGIGGIASGVAFSWSGSKKWWSGAFMFVYAILFFYLAASLTYQWMGGIDGYVPGRLNTPLTAPSQPPSAQPSQTTELTSPPLPTKILPSMTSIPSAPSPSPTPSNLIEQINELINQLIKQFESIFKQLFGGSPTAIPEVTVSPAVTPSATQNPEPITTITGDDPYNWPIQNVCIPVSRPEDPVIIRDLGDGTYVYQRSDGTLFRGNRNMCRSGN